MMDMNGSNTLPPLENTSTVCQVQVHGRNGISELATIWSIQGLIVTRLHLVTR